MDISEYAARAEQLEGFRWANDKRKAFFWQCPTDPAKSHTALQPGSADSPKFSCTGICSAAQILQSLTISTASDVPVVMSDLTSWKLETYDYAARYLEKQNQTFLESIPRDDLVQSLTRDLLQACNNGNERLHRHGLSDSELQEETHNLAMAAVGQWENQLPAARENTQPAPIVIPWEGLDEALEANEEYLHRTPVIDKLCYSSAVSMITGGKHAGKSTLARWMAISVAKGYDFLRRSVKQGPVLYIASSDETMAARQELIRLGWQRDDQLRFLSASKLQMDDQEDFLIRLTAEISRMGAVLTIVDMLFDFIPIDDEMSYAGTRKAVGMIQKVASGSGSHIVAIHHAPKNANIADAAVAALGSQGLAARVSPIILVRRFGPSVHSVSSTDVRDPRGQAIPDSRLIRNENGSVELGGAFKNYMLAEVYTERVRDLLEADPGSELTAPEVSEALTVSYEVARACLSTMFRNGLVQRSGSGKKGKPYRYSSTNSSDTPQNDYPFPTSTKESGERGISGDGSTQPIQQPFAYKD